MHEKLIQIFEKIGYGKFKDRNEFGFRIFLLLLKTPELYEKNFTRAIDFLEDFINYSEVSIEHHKNFPEVYHENTHISEKEEVLWAKKILNEIKKQ